MTLSHDSLRSSVAPRAPRSRVRSRDGFIDAVRVLAVGTVVLLHWTIPVLSYSDGRLTAGNVFGAPGGWLLTWVLQVMPLVFFAGGAANAMSLARASGPGAWTAVRLRRLAWPVIPLAAVWIPLPHLLLALGLPEQPVVMGARLAGQLLWFLAVYLLAVVSAPLLVRLHRRFGLAVPVAMGVLAAATDVVRFSGPEYAGFLNVVFVWLGVHQLGIAYGLGSRPSRRGAVAMVLGGYAAVAILVASGPYPASMVGLPGAAVSNMSPPTLCLLALGVGQVGVALLLRPALTRVSRYPIVEAAGARMMTIYLWHMPALITVGGVLVVGLGLTTPAPGSAAWWDGLPVWYGLLGLVLLLLLRLFARYEAPPARVINVGVARVAGASALIGGGLVTLMVTGFAPGPGPVAAMAALVIGVRLAR